MLRTVEAVVNPDGSVRLLESIQVLSAKRAIVTILEDEPRLELAETALLSEAVLAEDWLRSEEDEAWENLQSVP
jgi:hypothetical protein